MGKTRRLAGTERPRPLGTPRPRLPTWRSPRAFPAARRPRIRARPAPFPQPQGVAGPASRRGRAPGQRRTGRGPRSEPTARGPHPAQHSPWPSFQDKTVSPHSRRCSKRQKSGGWPSPYIRRAPPRPSPAAAGAAPAARGGRSAGRPLPSAGGPRGAGRGSSGVRGSFTRAPLLALPLGRRQQAPPAWALGSRFSLGAAAHPQHGRGGPEGRCVCSV